ncbi:DUF2188 domain-containing protein [Psychrilyobacter atlanticus]|uniref:DUF2188 domain-containing protein n=1 Tax=Psychrilyobacter atlanticus TaxID=271091 RepID=UPI000407EDBA|nr:DUF2188 domain-containing protein [Psychrilyobacter atlanticus]
MVKANVSIQHVMPNLKGGWSVKKDGSLRATKTFKEVKEAILYAEKIAINQKGDIIVHKKNGAVAKSIPYAKNSILLKGIKK